MPSSADKLTVCATSAAPQIPLESENPRDDLGLKNKEGKCRDVALIRQIERLNVIV